MTEETIECDLESNLPLRQISVARLIDARAPKGAIKSGAVVVQSLALTNRSFLSGVNEPGVNEPHGGRR